MPTVSERKKSLVMKALGGPAPTWRTVSSVAEETGLDPQTVRHIIAECGEEIIRSKVPAVSGEDLYTTHAKLKPLVLKALENPRYAWRTILGIATETRLDVRTIEEVLASAGDQVIKSDLLSEEGDELFTTSTAARAKSASG